MRISDWSSDVCSSDLVLEVKLNKTLEYGVSWFFGNQVPGTNLGLSQSLNDFSNVGSVISSAANSFTFVGPSAQAVVSALDTVSDVTVLSAPSVLVRNNVEATFNSGQQIPVASRSEEHTSELQSLMRISDAVFGL